MKKILLSLSLFISLATSAQITKTSIVGNPISDSIRILPNGKMVIYGRVNSIIYNGDSYTSGYRPVADTIYVTIMNNKFLLPSTNLALTSTGIWNSVSTFNANENPTSPIVTPSSALISDFLGLNEVKNCGVNNDNMYRQVIGGQNSIFLNHYLKSWYTAGGSGGGSDSIYTTGTFTKTYASSTVGGKSVGTGAYSSAVSATWNCKFYDSTVGIQFIGVDSSSSSYYGSRFNVLIDGNIVSANVASSFMASGVTLAGYDNHRSPFALFYTGLSYGYHTIQVVNLTSNANNFLIIDYVGHLVDKANAPPMLLWHAPYLTANAFATVAPTNGSAAGITKLNAKYDSLANTFAGYPVIIVPTEKFYDTITCIGTDLVHPNQKGDSALSLAAFSVLPNVTTGVAGVLSTAGVLQNSSNSRFVVNTSNALHAIAYLEDISASPWYTWNNIAKTISFTDGSVLFPKSTGSGTTPKLQNTNTTVNVSSLLLSPNATTGNISTAFYISGKGSGAYSQYGAISIFGSDYVADQVNYNYGTLKATGISFDLSTAAGGTGSIPLINIYTSGNTGQFVARTDGNITMANQLTVGGTTPFVLSGTLSKFTSVNNANIGSLITSSNTTSGTLASAGFLAYTGSTTYTQFGTTSAGFTTNGSINANEGYMLTSLPINIMADGNIIKFATGTVTFSSLERARFTKGGNFLVGTTNDSSAFIQIAASTTTNAGLYLTPGVALTTYKSGSLTWDGTHLYFGTAYNTKVDLLASSGATGANPTATIGTSAVNGSATTYMRSDAAPALPTDIPTRHIISNGPTPTTSSLGTNVTSATINRGKDAGFNITIVTSGVVSGTVCTINFGSAYINTPIPVFSMSDNLTAAGVTQPWMNSTSGSTITFGFTAAAAGTFTFNVMTIGN